MQAEPTTIASAAGLIVSALNDYGADVESVFRSADLDGTRLLGSGSRYPVIKMQRLWANCIEATGDPCFGLRVAEHMRPQSLHGLGFSWLASDTLLDALHRLVRYQRLISTAAEFSLREDDGMVQLVSSGHFMGHEIAPASIDAAMGVFLRMCRMSCGESFHPCRVSFVHARPSCFDRFYEYFRAPIGFGADENALFFDKQMLNEPLPDANPELARANDQVIIDYLQRFDRESISMQVRAQLIERLPDGQLAQKDVASALHMSVRNLQRRLLDEGDNFKQLLDDTRRELASQYIREKHRSIGEITYLLGFTEPSNFTRAFRRWTGMSPKEFRSEQQTGSLQ